MKSAPWSRCESPLVVPEQAQVLARLLRPSSLRLGTSAASAMARLRAQGLISATCFWALRGKGRDRWARGGRKLVCSMALNRLSRAPLQADVAGRLLMQGSCSGCTCTRSLSSSKWPAPAGFNRCPPDPQARPRTPRAPAAVAPVRRRPASGPSVSGPW